MKKLLYIALAATLVALWAGTGFAAITGTAHEITGTAGGSCAACHIPHAASGDRLWVEDPVSGAAPGAYGTKAVSPLCGYCHYTNMGGNTGAAWSSSHVYGDLSHGFATLMDGVTGDLPAGHEASGLPYMADAADATIECTTCHNVHDDTDRPFLRMDANVLCGACHGERLHQDTATGWQSYDVTTAPAIGAWGASISDENLGSHPVGTDVTANAASTLRPTTIPAIMSVATTPTAEWWALGGKLTSGDTGGVICMSCHAVHGIEEDTDFAGSGIGPGDRTIPNANFLAVFQSGGTIGPRTVANGDTGFNGLCEACHDGAALDAVYAASQTTDPNPGGTAFTHPVDDMNVISPGDWVTAAMFPADWPQGTGWTGSDADPAVICESCHGAHPAADAARADYANDGDPTASQYILRDSRAGICGDCHSASPVGTYHHPVGDTFQGDGATYLDNVAAGANSMSCTTCHSGTGAHNWSGPGAVGLDANWVPSDNARYATYDADLSKTCMDCHYSIETGSPQAGYSPLLGDGTGMEAEAGYADLGQASHYIGAIDPRTAYAGAIAGTNVAYWTATTTGLGGSLNPQVDDWSTAGGVAGGFSRFGGTGAAGDTVVVCESCHELEPDKNNNTAGGHLLLGENFTDQANGAMARDTDQFCEGCHLPRGTHPLTGDTVGRTGLPVDTDDSIAAWLVQPTSGPAMGAPANDAMSCDSCHQVHDAPNATRTFILDGVAALFDNTGQTLVSGSTADYSATYITPADDKVNTVVYQSFCNQCHPYE